MSRPFKLSTKAIRDVADILSQLHSEQSAAAADKMERRFFEAFNDLARVSALGHRREELTSEDILFYAVKPYVILLRQTAKCARITRVAHGARDLSKLI